MPSGLPVSGTDEGHPFLDKMRSKDLRIITNIPADGMDFFFFTGGWGGGIANLFL